MLLQARILVTALLASLSLSAGPAFADETADAQFESYVTRGVEAYKARKYVAAVKFFRDAYAIKQDPTLIFNIGKSYERLGKIEDAIANYQAYVDAPGTTAEDRADALNRIKALKQEQAARGSTEEPVAPQLPPETSTETKETKPQIELPAKVNATKGVTVQKAGNQLVLLVHKTNAIPQLTRAQVVDIYFGRMTSWPNGNRIRPYGRSPGSEAGKSFFTPKLGIDPGKYQQHWQQKQLSGAGLAPATVESTAALLKIIAANEGAIGYALASELPPNVEGVRIIELH